MTWQGVYHKSVTHLVRFMTLGQSPFPSVAFFRWQPPNSQAVCSGYKWWEHECRRSQASSSYHRGVFTCLQWAVIWATAANTAREYNIKMDLVDWGMRLWTGVWGCGLGVWGCGLSSTRWQWRPSVGFCKHANECSFFKVRKCLQSAALLARSVFCCRETLNCKHVTSHTEYFNTRYNT
jgi:hypothetical protein